MTPQNEKYGCKPGGEHAAGEHRLELIGQVMNEYHAARLAGEKPSVDEYVKKYAHLQPELEGFLQDEEWMYNALEPITSQQLPDGFIESVKEKLDARIDEFNKLRNST